ncbi:MAG TPA: IS4 family transposase [Chthonomonadales bacterium]|nr:IS4 family transposase [Chthonomonadales bacterium]
MCDGLRVTCAKHEVNAAWEINLPRGSIIAADRGYCDYRLFEKRTQEGVYFVTRQKQNALYEVLEEFCVLQGGKILSDQNIRFISPKAAKECPSPMRRIVVWHPADRQEIVLLTSHLGFGATTIAAIYKDRWEIELFFKVIKQHLKIKTFVGTSENALKTQIWTALITILLIKYLQFKSRCGWALCRLVALLRVNLFSYRDLWK